MWIDFVCMSVMINSENNNETKQEAIGIKCGYKSVSNN